MSRFSPAFATEEEAKQFLDDKFSTLAFRGAMSMVTPLQLNGPLVKLGKETFGKDKFYRWFEYIIIPLLLLKEFDDVRADCLLAAGTY